MLTSFFIMCTINLSTKQRECVEMKYDNDYFGYCSEWLDFESYLEMDCSFKNHIKKENGEIIRQMFSKDNLTLIVVARKLDGKSFDWNFTFGVKEDNVTVLLCNSSDDVLQWFRNYDTVYSDLEF